MTLQEFVNMAHESGRIFAVEFIKRTDGTVREMVCRCGVHKGLKGVGMGYDPKDHGLLNVYDMQKKGYRSIPVEAIQRLSMDGKHYAKRGLELVPIDPTDIS